MKKLIALLFFTVFLVSCSSVTKIVDKSYDVVIEDIRFNENKYGTRYTIIAWRYRPSVKKYVIYTDEIHYVGKVIRVREY